MGGSLAVGGSSEQGGGKADLGDNLLNIVIDEMNLLHNSDTNFMIVAVFAKRVAGVQEELREPLLKEGDQFDLFVDTFEFQNPVEVSCQDEGPALVSGPVKGVNCSSQELLVGHEKLDGLVSRKWRRLSGLGSKHPKSNRSQWLVSPQTRKRKGSSVELISRKRFDKRSTVHCFSEQIQLAAAIEQRRWNQ